MSIGPCARPAHADWPSSPIVNLPVCTAAGSQYSPKLVTDGTGGAIIVWTEDRPGPDADIYATRVLASGELDPAWPACGMPVCTLPGNQVSPMLVTDGAGGALLVWQDRRAGPSTDIYAHHLFGNGVLDPAWPVGGLAVCTADSSQLAPVIASVDGGAIVVWDDMRSRTNHDIYCQRILSTGAVAPGWPSDGLPVCVAPGDQLNPRVTAAPAQSAIVVWGDSRGGVADVYAQRVLLGGEIAWAADGLPVCAQAGAQERPEVVGDGAGGAFCAWLDYRNGLASDIYSGHLLADGSLNPTWPPNGRPLCVAPGDQTEVRLAPSGYGYAVAAWTDRRPVFHSDIYAQRVEGPSGDWPVDGRLVCGASGDQRAPTIVGDGYGGVIVAWHDKRSDPGDIYTQRVLASGLPSWAPNGVALSAAVDNQQSPACILEGSGGAIVTWTDTRYSGIPDVYAQRIQATGELGGSVLGTPEQARPEAGLVLGVRSPVRGPRMTIECTLPRDDEAIVEVLDVHGRRLRSTRLSGTGRHPVELELAASTSAGIYFISLRQGDRTAIARIALLR